MRPSSAAWTLLLVAIHPQLANLGYRWNDLHHPHIQLFSASLQDSTSANSTARVQFPFIKVYPSVSTTSSVEKV